MLRRLPAARPLPVPARGALEYESQHCNPARIRRRFGSSRRRPVVGPASTVVRRVDVVLQNMIEEGLLLVQEDPQHDLKFGFRCRLLSSFDEIDGARCPRSGRIKRVKLAALSVEKVLPLWDSGFPGDRGPYLALDLAKKLLAGTVPATAADQEYQRLWRHCDDLIDNHQDKVNVIMVGIAAAQALLEAFWETPLGCHNVNDATTDIEIDPAERDASSFAAAAYADGASWEGGSDKQKRLEFWTWWLTSAVSDATKG